MSEQNSDSERPSGQEPPRPRYGEYAPPGWTPPAPPAAQDLDAAAATSTQPGVPQYPGQQPAQPRYDSPAAPQYPAQPQQPTWSPAPGGAYAPGGWGDPAGPVAPPRRTGDLVATIILLAVGLFFTAIAIVEALIFSNPQALDSALQSQGRGGFGGQPGPFPAIIVVSHLVLWVLAVVLSIVALRRRRRAFWIPLAAGVLAAIVFWGCLIAIVASDPTLMPGGS